MAPRRQKKPIEALNVQIIDFTSAEDTIQCEVPVDPELLITHESPLELSTQPSTPSQPSTEDQVDRIEWTPQMMQVLFTELLEQANDGKRADNGFKKEAWESVLREVQRVYIGPYPISLRKIKAKEQTYKAYYKDWKYLCDQSGFGWDEETRMITAPDQAWSDICAVSYYFPKEKEIH